CAELSHGLARRLPCLQSPLQLAYRASRARLRAVRLAPHPPIGDLEPEGARRPSRGADRGGPSPAHRAHFADEGPPEDSHLERAARQLTRPERTRMKRIRAGSSRGMVRT